MSHLDCILNCGLTRNKAQKAIHFIMVDVSLPLKLNFHKNCCINCFSKEMKTNKNN